MTRLRSIVAAIFLTFVSTAAMADSLTWHFQNDHENIVDLELYSDTRKGHVWPGGNEVYTMKDGKVHNLDISCQTGEKVCYGAWVRGNSSEAWGAGKGGKGSCKSCCYVCGTGETPVLTFD